MAASLQYVRYGADKVQDQNCGREMQILSFPFLTNLAGEFEHVRMRLVSSSLAAFSESPKQYRPSAPANHLSSLVIVVLYAHHSIRSGVLQYKPPPLPLLEGGGGGGGGAHARIGIVNRKVIVKYRSPS